MGKFFSYDYKNFEEKCGDTFLVPGLEMAAGSECVFYVDKDQIRNYPQLEMEYREKRIMPTRCVHPKNYLQKTDASISKLIRLFFRLVKRKVLH
jgi:hypothetical protein